MKTICLLLTLLLSSSYVYGTNPDPVVAKVNDHEIRLSYVYQQIEALALGDQIDVRDQINRFVDSVVQEELLFQSMVAEGFATEPELRDEVKTLVTEYLVKKYVHSRIRVTPESIRAYYAEHPSQIRGVTVQARQILLSTKKECERLQHTIQSEGEFMKMATQFSLDPHTAKDGGNLGFFMNHPGPLGFEESLFDMKLGEMQIFETAQGCHLVRVVSRTDPPMPTLAEVEERIRFVLSRNQEIQLLRKLIQRASQTVNVERLEWKLP